MVTQLLVPGLHTVTLVYGILKVPPPSVVGPALTATGTTLETLAPLELLELLLEPLLLELPLELLLLELLLLELLLLEPLLELLLLELLLLELSLGAWGWPPPQAASVHRPSSTIQRKRWLMRSPRYWSSATDTPAGSRLGT